MDFDMWVDGELGTDVDEVKRLLELGHDATAL